MNQTQRKFVANRIFNILNKKMSAILDADASIRAEISKVAKVSRIDKYEAIKSGLVKLRTKKDLASQNIYGTDIGVYFDFTPLHNTRKEVEFKKFGKRIFTTAFLTNPMTAQSYSYTLFTEEMLDTLNKMNARMVTVVDELVLGDVKEAMDLITAIESEF